MSQERTIEGVVEHVVFSNEENGWGVVRLLVRGRGEITAVGTLYGVQPGETIKLEGGWIRDRKYGRQFRADSYSAVAPHTIVGIEKYLGSGLVPGIGAELARRLVQHFGLDTLEVIDQQPERLAEVDGIGRKRSRQIRESWREQREIKDVMVFLASHGVSTAHALKIYKLYGQGAVESVQNDPYRLARDVFGIGFRTADHIAQHLGIAGDDPKRLDAGTLHALGQATDSGHCYLPRARLIDQTSELLEVAPDPISESIDRLTEEGDLVVIAPRRPGDASHPSHAARAAVFPKPLAISEEGLAERLRGLTAQGNLPLRIDVGRAVTWYENQEQIQLAQEQRQALERALTTKVLVITGGPGTGKTTLVRGIVSILAKKKLRIELAAPTGRAAKRLGEATGGEAKTLHRLLEYNPIERGFSRGPDNPLAVDLLVVDEVSMLDTTLAYHLLKALPSTARLILVGDVDQLPSIGAGRVLADVIDSGVIEVARLERIFRQARESLIVVNAHRIRVGDSPVSSPTERGDFFVIEREDPEALLATLEKVVTQRIPQGFGFDPKSEIQVLTPMRRGLLGANHLNSVLQERLNADGAVIPSGGRTLRLGDRVMQRRNNYDLEVWNGDIGRIEHFDDDAELLRIDFEGRRVDYPTSHLDELVLAYATSIHKSQGSEYPCVVIPLHTQHYTLLQRNLLYTAVTRGRRLVTLVASRRALEVALETATSNRRHTLLAHRLRGEI